MLSSGLRRAVRSLATTALASSLLWAACQRSGAAAAAPRNQSLIEHGRYVALAADCMSCHTAPGGKPFAGGNALKSPIGTLYGANITPDLATGIGAWTREDFGRALRQGLRKDGAYLYPAMPYENYAKMSEADLDALWAYIRSVRPVNQSVPQNTLPFPFNVRSGLALWRALYFKPEPFKPSPGKSIQWNRGDYLVNALAHCNQCHTPRNLAQGLEPQHELTGANIEGWYAPDISSGPSSDVKHWSDGEFVKFLKSGSLPNNAKAFGPMQEVIEDSLQHLSDADLSAMVTYLKDQPAEVSSKRPSAVKYERLSQGKRVYEDNCTSCHRVDGGGRDASIPALAGNDAINAREPSNVIMAILEGFAPQGTWGAMGSFAGSLSDDQIADVANYVRLAWNPDGIANATPWAVSTWRNRMSSPQNESRALLCPNLEQRLMAPALALNPAELTQAATDRVKMAKLVSGYRTQVPKASRAEIVESLSTAYCRVLAQGATSAPRMGAQLADFGQQVAIVVRNPPTRSD